MASPAYGACSTKRPRRTKAAMAALDETLTTVVAADQPTTNRHTFYRAVSAGAIAKTAQEYRAVCRRLVHLRRAGVIPYHWLTDNTRWIRRPPTYGTVREMLEFASRAHRRTLWDQSPVSLEVWCESDSVASVLADVTDQWDVPLMVFRGYSGEDYVYTISEEVKRYGRPTHIYYFGDYDPSGLDIQRDALARVQTMTPEIALRFQRMAVTPEQITRQQLPTRPPKPTDPRTAKFQGGTVEIEALPAPQLRQLVADCILPHVDQAHVETQALAVDRERAFLAWCVEYLGQSDKYWTSGA
jgi:hypothetical protein